MWLLRGHHRRPALRQSIGQRLSGSTWWIGSGCGRPALLLLAGPGWDDQAPRGRSRRGRLRDCRSRELGAATRHDGSRHTCRAVAGAVVVDDRVAVCATGARRIVANAGRAAAKQHDAVLAIVERPKDDDAARAGRRLPGQPHSPCVDRRCNPEDVCRPYGRGARAASLTGRSAVPSRLFWVLSPSCPGLLSQGTRALPTPVSPGVPGRTSSKPRGDGASLRLRNSAEAAPAAKMIAESTTIFVKRAGRRSRGRSTRRPLDNGPPRSLLPGLKVAGVSAAARGSGSSARARSASTGSTSASSGLIGPRSASSRADAPKGRKDANPEPGRRLSPDSPGHCCKRPSRDRSRGRYAPSATARVRRGWLRVD